jgi:hypothetical protein
MAVGVRLGLQGTPARIEQVAFDGEPLRQAEQREIVVAQLHVSSRFS